MSTSGDKTRAQAVAYASMARRWIATATVWMADQLIGVMLITRKNERTIRPTERVTWPQGLKQRLMRRQNNTCVYCAHRRIARSFEIDHIVPVVRGGTNNFDNLQVICRPCNQRKGIQTDAEFRARYRRLVPVTPLRPPSRPIDQATFRAETKRTEQAAGVQQFRRSRFISAREKIVSGSLITGGAVGAVTLLGLAQLGAEGYLLLIPALLLGAGVSLGLLRRASVTGAMTSDND